MGTGCSDKSETLRATTDGWNCPCGQYTQDWAHSFMGESQELIIGEDMICPVTGIHCDDECCPVGSVCNISGSGLQPSD
jgi:hypothetical protein